MTVTFPLTLPTTPVPRRTGFRLRSTAALAQSPFTLSQQIHEHSGQMWLVDVTMPRMSRAQAAPWTAFFAKLRGRRGTFYLGDWDARTPLGNAGGTPVANSSGSPSVNLAGHREFHTTQWDPLVVNIMKAGDYFHFNDGTKQRLHMVVNDASSDSNGDAVFDIEPALRLDVANLTAITVENAQGVFRLLTNEPGWDSNHASRYDFTFACMEDLTQ
jgi:hypothetical protein